MAHPILSPFGFISRFKYSFQPSQETFPAGICGRGEGAFLLGVPGPESPLKAPKKAPGQN